MRILVLGAGATGGYFGGRLIEAGCDVTFLVRPARAERLAETGLIVESPLGDISRPVNAITADTVARDYDVVLLSCKAYDLDDAIATIAPAMRPTTQVPLLNGMSHLDRLDKAFGAARVLGGLCQIAAMLAPDGTVRHLNQTHVLAFGHRSEARQAFCEELQASMLGARIDLRRSDLIIHDMGEVGDAGDARRLHLPDARHHRRHRRGARRRAVHPRHARRGASDRRRQWLRRQAQGNGAGEDDAHRAPLVLRRLDAKAIWRWWTDRGRPDQGRSAASRRSAGIDTPMLRVAYSHLKAYEQRRDRLRRGSPQRYCGLITVLLLSRRLRHH